MKHEYQYDHEPIGEKLFAKVHQINQTVSGIELPGEEAKGEYATPTATVLYVGPDCKQIKPGDVILAPNSMPVYKVILDPQSNDKIVCIRESDVLSIRRPKKKD